MKSELKISVLSVVCAMCATMVVPAIAASSVRSLGGVGTYNGASNAAAAKSGENVSSGAPVSARAGSMRVNNVAGATSGATRLATTRAATTPRLSIGKYLSGSTAISGGSSVSGSQAGRPGKPSDGSDVDVTYLEDFVGYTVNGDTLPEQLSAIKLDVAALQSDIDAITGFVTDVVFDDVTGVLSVVIDGGETVSYNLADYFDGRIDGALQQVLDDITSLDGRFADYYTKSETDTILADYATKAELEALDIPSIEGLATSAKLAEVQEALRAAIDTKLESADLAQLQSEIGLLQSGKADATVVDGLKTTLQTISDDYAKKTELDAVELRLQNAINAVEIPALDAYATKQFVEENYVTKEVAKAYASAEQVQGIVSALADKAAGAEVQAIDARVTALESAGYQNAADVQGAITTAIADLATKAELANYAKKGESGEIDASMLNLGVAGEQAAQNGGGYLMLQTNSDGSSEWVNVLVD